MESNRALFTWLKDYIGDDESFPALTVATARNIDAACTDRRSRGGYLLDVAGPKVVEIHLLAGLIMEGIDARALSVIMRAALRFALDDLRVIDLRGAGAGESIFV